MGIRWIQLASVVLATAGCSGNQFDGEWVLGVLALDGEFLDSGDTPFQGSASIDSDAGEATMSWTVTTELDNVETTVSTSLEGSFSQTTDLEASLILSGTGTIESESDVTPFDASETDFECLITNTKDLRCLEVGDESSRNRFLFTR